MATLTVNVDDAVVDQFRRRVYQQYGKKKGVLGRALTEAMENWNRKKSYDRCMELLENGVDMGKMLVKTRDEIHSR